MNGNSRQNLVQKAKNSQKVSAKSIANLAGSAVVLAMLIFYNYDAGHPNSGIFTISGKDGELTVSSAGTVLNQYSALHADATAGSLVIQVDDVADLQAGAALGANDLVMVMQMQGASMQIANDTSYGRVTDYGSAGKYEFAYVRSVAGNAITLSCGLQNDYYITGHVQVIRVPQYSNLTIEAGDSVTAPAWDGNTGGVVALVAENTLILEGDDGIDVQG